MAISQLLPRGGFKWVDPSRFMPDKIDSYASWDSEGYLSEVDVRYPKELDDFHNNLPFMCENMKISGVEKLVPNLNDKKERDEGARRRGATQQKNGEKRYSKQSVTSSWQATLFVDAG